jgi:histidinol phosphatase-like PHP family hydrolase
LRDEVRRLRSRRTPKQGRQVPAVPSDAEMTEAAEYIYGAFHSSLTSTSFPELERQVAIEMEYRVTLAMIAARSCHAIAHPGGLSMKYHGSFPNELWDEIAKRASAADIALELNPGYGGDLAWQRDVCIKHGCRVVLGSNAHAIEELGMVVDTLRSLKRVDA